MAVAPGAAGLGRAGAWLRHELDCGPIPPFRSAHENSGKVMGKQFSHRISEISMGIHGTQEFPLIEIHVSVLGIPGNLVDSHEFFLGKNCGKLWYSWVYQQFSLVGKLIVRLSSILPLNLSLETKFYEGILHIPTVTHQTGPMP